MTLPEGVHLRRLVPHADARGVFTEAFRAEWDSGVTPVQWNMVRSRPGVLRGVHAHHRHGDYLLLAEGRASVGLHDLRAGSPTAGASAMVTLDARRPAAIVIPPGVAHGFLFHTPSIHVYAVSHYWDPDDELGCRYDDPGLGLDWPERPVRVSERDLALPGLDVLRAGVDRALGRQA